MRALIRVRATPHYRSDAINAGLQACGYNIVNCIDDPRPGDVLCIWNRYGVYHDQATKFEKSGGTVLVFENGYLGKDYPGGPWYACAISNHNGAGKWKSGGPERWKSFGIDLKPERVSGGEIIVLPQRGIGPTGVAMPNNWLPKTENFLKRHGFKYRVRHHPGQKEARPLIDDLQNCSHVVTWGSGAGIKAMLYGCRVTADFPEWIGSKASEDLFGGGKRQTRLQMFESLAWAMWRVDEIESGDCFRHLL